MSKNCNRVEIEDYDECEELLENINNGRTRTTCGALIVRVNEYLKKPLIEHDLTGILNNYLGVLQESGIYIQNGIFNTNFAEAALLLQGSVQLYGKKVDMLWDFVIEYLNRNMLYEEKTDENKDQFELLEERKEKFKRKRKILEENDDEQEQKSSRKAFVVDKSAANIQGMNFEDFQQYMITDHSSTSNHTTKTYEENWAERLATSNASILDNKLRNGNCVPSENSPENQMITNLNSIISHGSAALQYDLTEFNIYGEREPMGDYGTSSSFDQINREIASQHRQVHQNNIPDSQVARDDVQDVVLQKWLTGKSMRVDQVYAKLQEFNTEVELTLKSLYKLATKISEDGGERLTCFYQQPATSVSLVDDNNGDDLIAARESTESSLRCSTPLIESEINATNDINKELGEMMEKRNGSIRKTMDSDLESGVFDSCSISTEQTPVKGALSVISDGIGMDSPLSPQIADDSRTASPVNIATLSAFPNDVTVIEEVATEKCEPKGRRARKKLNMDDMDFNEDVLKKPKKSQRIKERMLPVITAKLADFTKFFIQHYTPADGEGELEPFEEDSDNDEDEVLGDLPDFDDSAMETSMTFNTTDVSTFSDSINVSSEEIQTDTTPITANSPTNETSFADIMCNDAATRLKHVLEWRKFITEKISKKKSDFDIHQEETNIIESVGEVGKSAKYRDMCAGKTSAEVSHNFIAMLHLVNTHNVSMSGVKAGRLSDDSLEIKLLSTDRHHEHLDEYNTSTAEEMQEKMICINKALKRQNSAGSMRKSSKKLKV